MNDPRETSSNINELQIVLNDNLYTVRISLPTTIMPTFKHWNFNDKVCGNNCTNNLRGFALLFCFEHFNRNRCFGFSFGEFNVITGNLNHFLTREKQLHLRFWLLSEYDISVEPGVFRSIHPKVCRKIAFPKSFPKFLEMFSWWSFFQRIYRLNTGLLHACYTVKQLLHLKFSKLLH